MSLVRTMLPYTLRDPYRLSTYKSEEYRALWPAAKDYLINLCECANSGVVDMIMPGCAGLCVVDRPDVFGGLGRAGSEIRVGEGSGRMGYDHAAARRCVSEGGVPGIPADSGELRRSYDREGRAGGAYHLSGSKRPVRADRRSDGTSLRRPSATRRCSAITRKLLGCSWVRPPPRALFRPHPRIGGAGFRLGRTVISSG